MESSIHRDKPPLVLIVDDDKTMRILLRRILEKDGYIIEEAENGKQALVAYEQHEPDLILLDAMMPKLNGFQTCQQLRAMPGGQHIPILMVTALDDPKSVDLAFEAGANDYIIKPIRHAVVRRRIQHILQVKQAKEALRESERQYRSLFEYSPISIWLEDFSEVKHYIEQLRDQGVEDFRTYFETHPQAVEACADLVEIVDINNMTLRMYECNNKAELLGNLNKVFIEGSQDLFREELITLSEGRTIFEGESVNQTLAGQKINVAIRLSLTPGYEETWSKVILSVTDITQQRQMEQSLLATQKLADLGTLAAGTAHEINSPLQVITGISQSLTKRLDQGEVDPDHIRRSLEIIHRNGWRCAEIVRSLRTYAHAATTQVEPNDLNAIVHDTLLLTEHQLKSWSGIHIITELASDLPPFTCDRNQITQVFINLLNNARDAMPEGGQITIRSYHDQTTSQLKLQVTDTGQGIPESVRVKIFDPFFTTKAIGKGTGLGLSIVAGIIRAHRGEIEVKSIPNQGTTFTIYFPDTTQTMAATGSSQFTTGGRFDDSIQPIFNLIQIDRRN
jgi:signal transduction histidine kinase